MTCAYLSWIRAARPASECLSEAPAGNVSLPTVVALQPGSPKPLMMMCALAVRRPSKPSLGFLERRELRFACRVRHLRFLDRTLLDPCERLLVRDQQHRVVASRGLRIVAVLPRGHRLTVA